MRNLTGCHCCEVQQAAGHNVQFVCCGTGRLQCAVRHVLLEYAVVDDDDDDDDDDVKALQLFH